MLFEEWIKEFALNQGTQIESYEMNKNGIIISLIYKVVLGTLEIKRKEDKILVVIHTNEITTKEFSDLLSCLFYLKDNGITFEEIIPTNLGKMFSVC